jgi:hypothetical protein
MVGAVRSAMWRRNRWTEHPQRATEAAVAVQREAETAQVRPGRTSLERIVKRFCIDMQRCPSCGVGELKIIAAILERVVLEKILAQLGLDSQPPPKGRVREAGLHFAARAARAVEYLLSPPVANLQPLAALRAVSVSPGQHQGQP